MRLGFWWTNIGNFLNKILGFIRTNLRLIIVGDSNISDLFLLSDKTVSLFRRIFIDGNFQAIFINHYAKEERLGKERGFATWALILMIKMLGVVTIVFCLASPFFLRLYRQTPANQTLLLKFTLALSPLILLIFLMSFFSALLNANRRFEVSGMAPTVGNLIYVCVFYVAANKYIIINPGVTLVVGALFYSLFQVLFMIYFSRKYFAKPIRAQNSIFFSDITKGVGVNLIVPFSEIFVGIVATTYGTGMLSHIDYGHRYIYILFTIIAVPISTAIIPSLSKKNAENNRAAFQQEATNAFVLTHILCLPFVFLLYIFTEDILSGFIHRVAQISEKAAMAKTIKIVSISLYFLMQNRILGAINNSAGQVRVTLNGSIIYGVVTIIASLILPRFSYFGLAWAGNLAYLCMFLYLFFKNIGQNFIFKPRDTWALIFSTILGGGLGFSAYLLTKHSFFSHFSYRLMFFGIDLYKTCLYICPIFFLYCVYLLCFTRYIKVLFNKEN